MLSNGYFLTLPRVLTLVVVLLIGKVTASVVLEYGNYFPPNFEAVFLLGRERYFWGAYSWAFYTHLVAGPVALLLGTLLLSDSLRRKYPSWHRQLGRVQVGCVLLLLVPSGLWMAWYALGGWGSATGLGMLAIGSGLFIVLGWRAAVQRRFVDHQRWMTRTFILLASAVVIRLIGGLAEVMHWDAVWLYPLATWLSWLVPLGIYEGCRLLHVRGKPMTIPASQL